MALSGLSRAVGWATRSLHGPVSRFIRHDEAVASDGALNPKP